MAAHRWHMIDIDNARHLSPAEALAAAEKLARTGTNFMYGMKVAGCCPDEIDHQIIEDLFYGLVEHIGRAGERGNARIAGKADAKKVPQTPMPAEPVKWTPVIVPSADQPASKEAK